MNIDSNIEYQLSLRFYDLMEEIPWIKPERDLYLTELSSDCGVDYAAVIESKDENLSQVLIVCKKSLKPSDVKLLASRLKKTLDNPEFWDSLKLQGSFSQNKPVYVVFAAPWLSKRTAECIKAESMGWFDLAGNVHMSFPGVYIHKEGVSNPFKSKEKVVQWTSEHAQRILRELLEPKNIGKSWRQRELSEKCFPSVSLGMVNKVVKKLVEDTYAEETRKGLILTEPKSLLQDWGSIYTAVYQGSRSYYTMFRGDHLESRLEDFFVNYQNNSADPSVTLILAGLSAAKKLAPYLRGTTHYWYATPGAERAIVEALELKEVDKGANMVLWVTSRPEPFRHAVIEDGKVPTTSLIQTYLDTYSSGERGMEAAEHLLAHKIIPEWNQWKSTNQK